ncbi:MAG: hypothetical protein ABJQ70_21310 [Roseobacter sp.]
MVGHVNLKRGFALRSRKKTLVAIFPTIAIILTACATPLDGERVVRDVSFVASYNDISGELSDGSKFTGVAWFRENRLNGDFCLQAADAVCSGKFSARVSRRISGEFICSDGITGTYITERLSSGSGLVPISGTGELSDGRTATVLFSKKKNTRQTARCFLPPA